MTSSNATPSAFGWDFQANLALYLVMDEDLKQIEKFKVEGKTEDIEIYYRHSTEKRPMLVQAKSQEDPMSDSTTKKHLTNAINSLLRAVDEVDGEYSEVTYGTNIEIPIRAGIQKSFFEGLRKKYKYSELPVKFQQKLNEIMEDSNIKLDRPQVFKERLSILKISFHGQDDETRYGVVKAKVVDKLCSLGVERHKCNRIFGFFQKEFIQNASKRFDYNINELGLTIILLSIESDETQSFEKLDVPEEFIARIKTEFSDYISEKQLNFQFISQLVGDYKKYVMNNPKMPQTQKIQYFTNENFQQYQDYFLQKTANINQELIDNIIKVTLYRILSNRVEIDTIKERMALDEI
ncbi:hypothetical protein GGG87_04410 [Streptococcus sp. zg-86]|uniref:DUF4297 domain-containing protein n=1 Tax=Streptococcus zhangguiae TaxID=2664091 RepID=A0A6I4RFP7_9STRE|nr:MULTISPECIES: hypothetical protein [unclassified Streptococcus]MTB64247.1 hypothetical protein [Streptococcus sp. zg-86]MTB90427.1 hypothetical protein [Streptococcus sp. zg-36]MWV56234.1 hypothetical protein [Streptococcus sp. zg-70]QTH48144.1 hypothetical protein J5M87_02115 [Streptococcus sp. zg-86]